MRKKSLIRNEKGLSLIELLAAITISTLIIGVCFAGLYSLTSISTNSSAHFTDMAKERKALDYLTRYITFTSQSNNVVSPTELKLAFYENNTTANPQKIVSFKFEPKPGSTNYELNLYTIDRINNTTSSSYSLIETLADNLGPSSEDVFSQINNTQIGIKLPFLLTFNGKVAPSPTPVTTIVSLNKY
jgi:hypothetical protein